MPQPPTETGDSATDAEPAEPVVQVALTALPSCDGPSSEGPHFRVTELPGEALEVRHLNGAGLAVDDLDGDGRYEVLRALSTGLQVFLQEGDSWAEVSGERLPAGVDLTEAAALSTADYDADGDVDLFVARFDRANVLLVNDGAGRFVDGTPAAIAAPERFSLSSAWADLDLDGDLDLFVGNYGDTPPRPEARVDPSEVWLNHGDGTFVDASAGLPDTVQQAFLFMGGLYDLNHDRYPDLVSITDFFYVQPSRIAVSEQGERFVVDGGNNFQNGFNGMGLGTADINGDGVQDFVQSSTGRLSLMLSSPAATPSGSLWIETAGARGLVLDRAGQGHIFGWGTDLADLDNNGTLDVPMAFGFWDEFPQRSTLEDPTWQRDALYVADAEGNFTNQAAAWGFDEPRSTRGLVVQDLNQDGWLDVVKAIIGGPTQVLMGQCGLERALLIDLRDETTANTRAVGAQVTVEAEGRTAVRFTHEGSASMFSDGPGQLHFGLGQAETATVTIRWPDHQVTTLPDVPAHQRLLAVRVPKLSP